MSDPKSGSSPQPDPNHAQATEHIAEAHRLLTGLRARLDQHPELEEAIEKLEMALSALTIKSGGLL